ncbi:hypothetical protein K431DRAFT_322072 [Polychaeton citri CBS 116435]|uniref:Na+/H+ antiporter n=1 Tax=Polychaeton citri CBS 116435 TaxID=1314669 RepID=A0A9P4UMI8_9PEZI|nr:hypothetical protein K431DRAFT_322072 [Polychaeton citri CBS 116435]
MAWDHLSVNRPHLVYIILGGFTTLFMLVSSVIKERLYIGEATVATLCGIIFGPHAANLIDPRTWGNEDQITLEFARLVLVIQCFAVGVELPKYYMERHWRSVTLLLVPVMTFGWLITSLFIWAFFNKHINWLDSLCIAACVTATDPVLASSVVGKGKFAKRVPKHLRDLLSAESGCNDGMAFPFIYLAIYIIRYKHHPDEVALHWFCYTILYECVFGAVYGVLIGYAARRAIRLAHEHDWIDRESFLVFYFVLALFCAGSGSILGVDDLLVGFACGVGFSNDGWFTEKTEESHVSNVIDLLINLAFFVYFGTIIPWGSYNAGYLGLDVWRLVVIAILVLFFRRIPIMVALKPIIPDIKTWRESLFAGHFGPIGVGAIFVAILARAELETEETTPLAELPPPGFPHLNIIELIWPITTFLVITSILVHGSSIAVFTLGKHINTLTLTMSYTQANDPKWLDRLPRIQSRSKTSSMSMQRSDSEFDEKMALGPGMLPPVAQPGTFLRRQKEDDNPSRSASRSNSRHRKQRSRDWETGRGPGGPVSASAIKPAPRNTIFEKEQPSSTSDSDTLAMKSESPTISEERQQRETGEEVASPAEIYEEGQDTVFEDEQGNVLAVEHARKGEDQAERESDERAEGKRLVREESAEEQRHARESGESLGKSHPETEAEETHDLPSSSARPGQKWREGVHKMQEYGTLRNLRKKSTAAPAAAPAASASAEPRHGPARAYQFGNTIIIEDEDGEVIKKYDIPGPDRKASVIDSEKTKQRLGKMGKMLGLSTQEQADAGAGPSSRKGEADQDEGGTDDDRVRFTMSSGGRRMSKADFFDHIRQMDPKNRAKAVENSNAPEAVKQEARKDVREQTAAGKGASAIPMVPEHPDESNAVLQRSGSNESQLHVVDENNESVPFHDVSSALRQYNMTQGASGGTAAERRRQMAAQQASAGRDSDSEDDGTERIPPSRPVQMNERRRDQDGVAPEVGETAAERRRREGALGIKHGGDDSDSEEDNEPRHSPQPAGQQPAIRFAEPSVPQPAARRDDDRQQTRATGPRLRWGKNVGR